MGIVRWARLALGRRRRRRRPENNKEKKATGGRRRARASVYMLLCWRSTHTFDGGCVWGRC